MHIARVSTKLVRILYNHHKCSAVLGTRLQLVLKWCLYYTLTINAVPYMVHGYNYYWVLYHKFVIFPKTFKLRGIVQFKRGKSCHVSSKPQVTCYCIQYLALQSTSALLHASFLKTKTYTPIVI